MKVTIPDFNKDGSPRTMSVKVDKWDTYNADHTLALVILPVLKQFRNGLNRSFTSFPVCMYEEIGIADTDETLDATEEQTNQALNVWKDKVDKMIWSFEQIVEIDDSMFFFDGTFDKNSYDKHEIRIQYGLDLFAKHFRSLWQ